MARWKGKAIGAGLGWLFGGPLGAILGGVTGDIIDKTTLNVYPSKPLSDYDRSLNFVTHLVGILVSIAKSDGHLSTHEVKVIEKAFINFGFKGDDLNFIRNLINQTSRVQLNLSEVCFEFKQYSNYEERLSLLRIVYLVAYADGVLHRNEESMINHIIDYLDISTEDAFEIRGEFCADNDKNYKILSVSRHSSNEDIKKAYRTLSKQYHPDRVTHLGDEFAKLANNKFQQINTAYEEIRKEKGF
ncbi:MAG: DnaJ domain-containing protein [Planctomycetes bacterium]|nr:DnaJ domain-containing protein [Planctomycetota bacterium]